MDTSKLTHQNAYALIAGGSKGIGFAIAEALAKRGYDLILVARHMDALQEAKRYLESTYNIRVDILSFDLSREETATRISLWCTERNIPLKILCNVAGLGGEGDYLSLPLDSLRYMIHLNLESTMAMCLSMKPAKVGEVTVRKMLRGRPVIVPGTLAKVLSWVLRIAPQRWVTYVYGKSAERSNRKAL
ncbi:MAG: SDR family NAD(P)-dependent oxidoreductase [Chitinophagaceae bacterium]|nr:SDR family NAD(P)-dependent oxidoreductase [Chitinophagaceae bacterium]